MRDFELTNASLILILKSQYSSNSALPEVEGNFCLLCPVSSSPKYMPIHSNASGKQEKTKGGVMPFVASRCQKGIISYRRSKLGRGSVQTKRTTSGTEVSTHFHLWDKCFATMLTAWQELIALTLFSDFTFLLCLRAILLW